MWFGEIHRTTQDLPTSILYFMVIAKFSEEEFWISTSWTCQKINMDVMVYENGFVSIHEVHRARHIMVDATNNMKIIQFL